MSSISRRALLASSALAAGGITTKAAWAGADRKPRPLRHMLSNETYSLRDEIAAGKVSLLTAAEFFKKELGILAVIKQTDPKWVGSCLDFGNHPVDHKPEVFSRLAPYAYHTHAKLAGFKADGEATNADYGTLLGILKRVKYPGAVSVEWEGE